MNVIEGRLREEDAQRVRDDRRFDAAIVNWRREPALPNLRADGARLPVTQFDRRVELRRGADDDESGVSTS